MFSDNLLAFKPKPIKFSTENITNTTPGFTVFQSATNQET